MSEVKMYECTVLIDASCGVTVEASSPEEAAELAENLAAEKGAGSLCHQCSSHTECGDSYAVIVYDDDKEVLDTDHRSKLLIAAQVELSALREELLRLEEEYDTLEHANITLKLNLAAAEQRNADTIAKLELAASMMDDDERGNRFAEICRLAIKSLKPTESGASAKCVSDGGTCGLGGTCHMCPHKESGASE